MPSTWLTARQIIRSEGFGSKGLLKGITATLGRHGLFNAVYFGSYYNMKRFFVSPEVKLYFAWYDCRHKICNKGNPHINKIVLTSLYVLEVHENMKPWSLIFCIPYNKAHSNPSNALCCYSWLCVYVSDAEFNSITALLRIFGGFFLQFS